MYRAVPSADAGVGGCGEKLRSLEIYSSGKRWKVSCEDDQAVTCPCCQGHRKAFVTGIVYAEGHSGPYCDFIDCFMCKGSGVVAKRRLFWMEEGQRIRRRRIDAGITLLDASRAAGMKPSEWSTIESGRCDPSGFTEVIEKVFLEAERHGKG